jgi:uncharacterized protein (TIGR03435 family)
MAIRLWAIMAALAAGLWGQPLEFEAASIKPSAGAENGIMVHFIGGGPGTPDPGHFRCMNCTPGELVMRAYDVEKHQVSGPEWLNAPLQITAKVPVGATREQLRAMLQSLLAERFKLACIGSRRTRPGTRWA